MINLYFVTLNNVEYLPYVWGMLRSYSNTEPMLQDKIIWHYPETGNQKCDDVVRKIENPDVVCFSCYLWNFSKHLRIARDIKKRYPTCKIVMGGPQIPQHDPEFHLRYPYVDSIIIGEGETAMREFLLDFLHRGSVLHRYIGEKIKNLDDIPSPYLAGYFDGAIKSLQRRNLPLMMLWETTRGCPYACTYCDWGGGINSRIRKFSDVRLSSELKWMAEKRILDLEVCDANFGIMRRDVELAKMVRDSKLKYGYPRTFRNSYAKNSSDTIFRISQILKEADLAWATTLSFQTFSGDALVAVKRDNIGVERYNELQRMYNDEGIPTFTEMILGLPMETKESWMHGLNTLMENDGGVDIRVFELIMLPNSELFDNRDKYELNTMPKYLFPKERSDGVIWDDDEIERIEIVTSTSTMPKGDYKRCYVINDFLQTLHCGGYTRFLSKLLHKEYGYRYIDFYEDLYDYMVGKKHILVRKIEEMVDLFMVDEAVPQVGKVFHDAEMRRLMSMYSERTGWAVWHWGWMCVSETIDEFYELIWEFLEERYGDDLVLAECMRYQQDMMLTIEYDPVLGKSVEYTHDWLAYFDGGELEKVKLNLQYTDEYMGLDHRYPLVKGDREKFVYAAVGSSYPWSRYRHFYHQRDKTVRV